MENTWPFWIFDSSKSNQVSTPDESKAETDTHEAVFITSDRFHAETLLNEGKRVLFELPYEDTSYDCPPVRFNPSFWNSQMGPTWARGMGMIIQNAHSAFASFPTTADGGWQWQSLIENARGLRVEKLGCDCITNLVQPIDEWNRNDKMSLLFECQVGTARLMMTSINLEQDTPQAAALKKSILSYMKSDAFEPQGQVSWKQLSSLFEINDVMKELDAKIDDDSLSACLDGNPQTFVRLTGGYPYSFIIQTTQKHNISGILYMPRQNHREHEGELRSYCIEAWVNDTWKQVQKGKLSSSYEPKRITFLHEVYTDRIRFTALDTFSAPGKSCFWAMEPDGLYQKEADTTANPEFKGQLPQDIFSASVINLLLAEEEEMAVWKQHAEQRSVHLKEAVTSIASEKSATAEIDN